MRIKGPGIHDWFAKALRAKNRTDRDSSKDRIAELNRQISGIREQEVRLLNFRLLEEIDASAFARKSEPTSNSTIGMAYPATTAARHFRPTIT